MHAHINRLLTRSRTTVVSQVLVVRATIYIVCAVAQASQLFEATPGEKEMVYTKNPVKNSADFEKGPARWFITVLATHN